MTKSFKDLGNTLREQREHEESAARAREAAEKIARQKEEERKKQRALDLQNALVAFDAESFRILRGAYKDLLETGAEVSGGQETPGGAGSTEPTHVFTRADKTTQAYDFVLGNATHQWLSFFDLKIRRSYRVGFARHQTAGHVAALVLGQTLNGEVTHKSLKTFNMTEVNSDKDYAAKLHDALFNAIHSLVESQ